ncbi:hypothetical protein [Marmoricola sp. RAF53]|uniref:hypothetical protein n=1 Tax=Marmoricola sp. RAF53 TaxID=3233059 RepID=UPI003F9E8232
MSNRDEAGQEEGRRAREEAEWRDIVDHFGDRAELPEDAVPDPPEPAPAAQPGGVYDGPPELAPAHWSDDDRFVPPPPPPVPRAHGLRLLAWIGLFGVPALALLGVVLGISLPSPLGLLLIVWFVGGFGYLVATMSNRGSGGGWDDGAVL